MVERITCSHSLTLRGRWLQYTMIVLLSSIIGNWLAVGLITLTAGHDVLDRRALDVVPTVLTGPV